MPSYVVVGASRGLGYEWLRQLSSDGRNTVVGLVRTVSAVEAKLAAEKITNVSLLSGDMANFASLNAAAAETAKLTNGSVDYLIINGAFSDPETDKLVPTQFIGREDELRKDMIESLDVNVLGVAHSINVFLPLVRKSSIKKITAISTGLAVTEETRKSGVANFFTYSTMKAALNMVVAKYSAELKHEGITLLALSPGLAMTKETPPTPQEMADFEVFRQVIQRTKPDWRGPMMLEESVKH